MKITGIRFPPKGGCEVQIQVGDEVAMARVDQDAVAATGARAIPLMLAAIQSTAHELEQRIARRDKDRGPDESPVEE